PGHDPSSHLPGEHGNCIIAAHRNMYGWWFYRLGQLGSNSIIKLKSPTETYTYKVAKMTVTHATDTAILDDPINPDAAPRLTLYTCAIPHGSKRIVVVANQVEAK
ncbi:MAG: sortase, partial [Abitibacteriaceae bacterium]|nr:sortase [Abditibacteriaceae bacterium]